LLLAESANEEQESWEKIMGELAGKVAVIVKSSPRDKCAHRSECRRSRAIKKGLVSDILDDVTQAIYVHEN
jgi:hypothetical protein